MRGQRVKPVLLVMVGLVVGLLVGFVGGVWWKGQEVAKAPTPTPAPTVAAPSGGVPAEVVEQVVGQVRYFMGEEDAPVVMVVFSDFQCPFCGQFARETLPEIEKQYVQTGKVRLGFIHYAFLGDESVWAAQATECAGEQGAFWAYHDLLFERQSGENQGVFTQDHLKEFAQELGLDTQAFGECLDSGRYAQVVADDRRFLQSLGVQSTPSFLVGDVPMVGAESFATFQQVIEGELSERQ